MGCSCLPKSGAYEQANKELLQRKGKCSTTVEKGFSICLFSLRYHPGGKHADRAAEPHMAIRHVFSARTLRAHIALSLADVAQCFVRRRTGDGATINAKGAEEKEKEKET